MVRWNSLRVCPVHVCKIALQRHPFILCKELALFRLGHQGYRPLTLGLLLKVYEEMKDQLCSDL